MTDEVDDLLIAVRKLGITPVMRDGCPNLALTYEALRSDPPKLEAFADLMSEYLARPSFLRAAGVSFYDTELWRALRYQAFAKYGNRCQCCGAGPQTAVLHVDHIKPRSKFPALALSLDNLQILCADCNRGKSNKDDTDWRE